MSNKLEALYQNTVTYQLGMYFLGTTWRYGTYFLAVKRWVHNAIFFFYFQMNKTNLEVVIPKYYTFKYFMFFTNSKLGKQKKTYKLTSFMSYSIFKTNILRLKREI